MAPNDFIDAMNQVVQFSLRSATAGDAGALAALHTAVATHLTDVHGRGPWSSKTTEKGVLLAMRTSQVFVAQAGAEIVGSFRLTTKKPWAIDPGYFTPCRRPLYLVGMAIVPERQRQGLGRRCLTEVERIARAWPAEAIWLDAYDAKAGAGDFYARCGFTQRGQVVYRGAPLVYYEFRL